ncbi:MAG: phosphate/phosphite/phosphonate ABC transporter substrate-binding protein [Sulfurovum sp.]
MKLFLLLFILFTSLYSKDIVFGIVPQQNSTVLLKKWLPFTKELSQITGYNIILKIQKSIPKFERELYLGKYDVAYMNPYHFIIANKLQKYSALIRSQKLIQGIVVGDKNRQLNRDTIINSTFLFPAPKAFAATLLTKYELNKKFDINIDKDSNIIYVNSHDSVYKGVGRNIGDFGGGIIRTFNNLSDIKTKKSIFILYKTQKYPSHPIAIHPRLSKEIRDNIQNGLLKISDKRLNSLNIKYFIITTDNEYKDVKKLAIELDIY